MNTMPHPRPTPGEIEPYRIFFPLGVAMGLAGVSIWVLYALGGFYAPSAAAHVGLSIQGFVFAFALGFLLTALPKMTGGPPVGLATQSVLATLLVASAVGFWTGVWPVAEGGFLLAILGLLVTAFRIVRRGNAPLAPPFVAVGAALFAGVLGAGIRLAVVSGWMDAGFSLLGRRLITEGMLLLLVVGVGARLAPMLMGQRYATRIPAWIFGAVAVLVVGSLLLEHGAGIEGLTFVRALPVAAVMTAGLRLWSPPTRPTAIAMGMWLSHVLVVLGLLGAALLPVPRTEILHVALTGGISIMIVSVATRVVMAHGGYPSAWEDGSRPLWIANVLLVAAMLVRVTALLGPVSLWRLGTASLLWAAGLLVWSGVMVPRMFRAYRPGATEAECAPAPAAASGR
jgi:uncharacterized protein involved in response to NO